MVRLPSRIRSFSLSTTSLNGERLNNPRSGAMHIDCSPSARSPAVTIITSSFHGGTCLEESHFRKGQGGPANGERNCGGCHSLLDFCSRCSASRDIFWLLREADRPLPGNSRTQRM